MPVRTATRYTVCATSKEKANGHSEHFICPIRVQRGHGAIATSILVRFTAFIWLYLDAQDELLGIIVLVEGGDHELL